MVDAKKKNAKGGMNKYAELEEWKKRRKQEEKNEKIRVNKNFASKIKVLKETKAFEKRRHTKWNE